MSFFESLTDEQQETLAKMRAEAQAIADKYVGKLPIMGGQITLRLKPQSEMVQITITKVNDPGKAVES